MWPGILLASLTILDASRHQHGGRLLDLVRILCVDLRFHIFTSGPTVGFEKVSLSMQPSLSV